MTEYKTRIVGARNTIDYRVFLENSLGKVVSPFHDIPLYANKEKTVVNMVVEIPRWTNAKLAQVKILGTLALLDQGETDWKVICIDVTDPLASKLNDIEDVEKHMPGLLPATTEWFTFLFSAKRPTVYTNHDSKSTQIDSKTELNGAFSDVVKNKDYTNKVIYTSHEVWRKLITRAVPSSGDKYKITVANTEVSDSPYKVSTNDTVYKTLPADSRKPAVPIHPTIDKWFCTSGEPTNLFVDPFEAI
ncbi:Inorganic pyrophosphatase [Blyttiomyces sp. JEL0837]|nr:Inorganic pyrophosphatase [Blyttiomyces sp. JEL0837]